jgi:hypothetical protein
MVVNGYGEGFLGLFLTDYVLVQLHLDAGWCGDVS